MKNTNMDDLEQFKKEFPKIYEHIKTLAAKAFDTGKYSAMRNYLNHAGFQHEEIEKDKQFLLSQI